MSNMTTGTSNQTPVTSQSPVGTSVTHTSHNRTRSWNETKSAFKTTELMAYIASVVGILIASYVIDGGDSNGAGNNGGDYFRADKAFLYITIVTVGYLVSRGLAKSGSRDSHDS